MPASRWAMPNCIQGPRFISESVNYCVASRPRQMRLSRNLPFGRCPASNKQANEIRQNRQSVFVAEPARALLPSVVKRYNPQRTSTHLPCRGASGTPPHGAFGLSAPAPQDVFSNKSKLGGITVAFTVPPLPYSFDALEPHIDAKTMEIHHDKHHGAYVTNLNKALEGHADLQSKSLEDLLKNLNAIPENIRQAVRNNA